MNNILTWYSYRKEFDCDEFITIRKWIKNNKQKVNKKFVLDYLESYFGKIGEEPKECDKKIKNKVIVITKNGKIKQFRILCLAAFNFSSIENPITNSTECPILDDNQNTNSEYRLNNKFNFEKEFIKYNFKYGNSKYVLMEYFDNSAYLIKNPEAELTKIEKLAVKSVYKRLISGNYNEWYLKELKKNGIGEKVCFYYCDRLNRNNRGVFDTLFEKLMIDKQVCLSTHDAKNYKPNYNRSEFIKELRTLKKDNWKFATVLNYGWRFFDSISTFEESVNLVNVQEFKELFRNFSKKYTLKNIEKQVINFEKSIRRLKNESQNK